MPFGIAPLIYSVNRGLQSTIDDFEKMISVGIGNRNDFICDEDPAALNRFYSRNGNHVGFMHPTYFGRRDHLFQFAKVLEGHYFFVDGMDSSVVSHALNKDDIFKIDLIKSVFSLNENIIQLCFWNPLCYILLRFVDRL